MHFSCFAIVLVDFCLLQKKQKQTRRQTQLRYSQKLELKKEKEKSSSYSNKTKLPPETQTKRSFFAAVNGVTIAMLFIIRIVGFFSPQNWRVFTKRNIGVHKAFFALIWIFVGCTFLLFSHHFLFLTFLYAFVDICCYNKSEKKKVCD